MVICNNCGDEVEHKFCSNCGNSAILKRIDAHYIIHEIEHVLHLDRGILYTIKQLILKPGETVRKFLTVNRSRVVKPIIFIIVTSLLYSLISHFFHVEQEYVNVQGMENSSILKMGQWVQGNYGYANMIMAVFIAGWLKLFFKKRGYNFFEIMILLCFVMGIGMLFFAIAALIQGVAHVELMQISGMIGLIYMTWAIGQFFDGKKFSSYLKALLAYIFGMLSAIFAVLIIGLLIDFVILK